MRKSWRLTQNEAIERSKNVLSSVEYWVSICVHAGDTYQGQVVVRFTTQSASNTFLDFAGDKVTSLVINNHKVNPELYKDGKIHLQQPYLLKGLNIVTVTFENRYYDDGKGFVETFSSDKKRAVYTWSEPNWNPRVFPLFDQPDLRSIFTLAVAHPVGYQPITSTRVKHLLNYPNIPQSLKGFVDSFGNLPTNYCLSIFEPSAPLPPYLFAFACGEFEGFVLREGLTMYALPGQGTKNVANWQKLYRAAVDLSVQRMGVDLEMPMPYDKIDAVLLPGLDARGMEYPGAIFYAEDAFDSVEQSQVNYMIKTVFHEVAHMWFGNLVALKWWNETWLKEGFADFFANRLLRQLGPQLSCPPEETDLIVASSKRWGMNRDASSYTHPLTAVVPSTDEADANFDGISYSKGAAVIENLCLLIGEAEFFKGLRRYLKAFQLKSATVHDLINCFARSGQFESNIEKKVIQWKEEWVDIAGLNVVCCCARQGSINFKQAGLRKEFTKLKSHYIELRLVNTISHKYLNVQVVVAPNSGSNMNLTKDEVELFPPNNLAILPNIKNTVFARVCMDSFSASYFMQAWTNGYLQFTPAEKYSCLSSLFDSVRTGTVACKDFLFGLAYIVLKENNSSILDSMTHMFQEAFVDFLLPTEVHGVVTQLESYPSIIQGKFGRTIQEKVFTARENLNSLVAGQTKGSIVARALYITPPLEVFKIPQTHIEGLTLLASLLKSVRVPTDCIKIVDHLFSHEAALLPADLWRSMVRFCVSDPILPKEICLSIQFYFFERIKQKTQIMEKNKPADNDYIEDEEYFKIQDCLPKLDMSYIHYLKELREAIASRNQHNVLDKIDEILQMRENLKASKLI